MITNPVTNSIDDFADDFTSTVVFNNLRDIFDPLKSEFDKKDDAYNSAMSGAITTLQMGISMMAINYVTNTLLPNIAVRGVALYSYIISGKIAKGLATSFSQKTKNIKKGRVLGKLLSFVTDGQKERSSRAGIANDMVSHLEIMQSRKEKIANDTKNSLDSSMIGANSKLSQKSLALYTEKTKTGTWTTSKVDKKIYERATGQKLTAGVTWSTLSKKLNSFSEFAKSAEEQIINLAQVQFDTFTANGSTKVN